MSAPQPSMDAVERVCASIGITPARAAKVAGYIRSTGSSHAAYDQAAAYDDFEAKRDILAFEAAVSLIAEEA